VRNVILGFIFLLLISASLAQTSRRHPQRSSGPTETQKQQFANDQEAINALHDDDIKGSMSLNADTLESLWTDDVVTIAPGEPPVVGREANRAKLDKAIEQMREVEILAYDEQFQEVRVEGDLAYEYGTISGRTRPFKGGAETSYKYNVLRLLTRQPDGSWKIARSMYNDATPPAAKPAEPTKPAEPQQNKLKD
jgi:uncharacterized protein (TIGR02246 family)